MPDRHFDETEGITLTDHLLAVARNCRVLLDNDPKSQYLLDLRVAIESSGLVNQTLEDILIPVALLHDIGKVREDKTREVLHPVTGRPKKARHPLMGLFAALELLHEEIPYRDSIVALVEEHDTPYSWYVQSQKTEQVPSSKAWGKLDRKIWPAGDGTGIFLLGLFKLADVDGHEETTDVSWFFEQANRSILETKRKSLPIPTESDIRGIVDIAKRSS